MTDIIKQRKPKVITLQTPCVSRRTLVVLEKQADAGWSNWDAVVTSLEDYYKWHKKARIVGIILYQLPKKRDTFYEELYKISSDVPMILLSSVILQTKTEEYWTDNFDNVVHLDELQTYYPFLGHPWDKTKEDAVGLFAHLSRYNRIVDCVIPVARYNTFNDNITVEHNIVPPTTMLVTQYFRHPDKQRATEIMECLRKNVESDVSQIVLLTEKDYSKDWQHLQTKKIQQIIIKKRLTYAHFLQYVTDRVPKNVIVILANADIFLDRVTDLYKINLKNAMVSLLRWDIKDTVEDIHTAEIFGPRADSQDTWVLLSDSVKETKWPYEQFDIQLGQPGCDNIFAGLMLQNRFVLYNPSLTVKTYHYHLTAIRDYKKEDALRANLYINIVPSYMIDTKQVKDLGRCTTLSNEVVSFQIKSSSVSNEIAYCTMVGQDGRYKWEPSVENLYFDEIPLYQWTNSCVTPNGLVYTPYTIYPGNDLLYPYWKSSSVHIYTPLQKTDQMIAYPLADMSVFNNRNTYCLYYLSRILRVLQQYPNASFWISDMSYIKDMKITSTPLLLSDDTACYAREVIGFLPSSLEIGKEEIGMLREQLTTWKSVAVYKRCVVIGEFHHKKQLSELLYKDWFIEYVSEATPDIMVGVALCIVTPCESTAWAPLWALPKGAYVIEFQQELEVHGELQHIAHVSELRPWIFLLSKGSESVVQKQMMNDITKWVISHEDEIEIK